MDKAPDDNQPSIPLPSSRFFDYDNFRYYYAYGNTPAEDLLQSVGDQKVPSVLMLGCGDLRSCFYTLWKNFSSYAVETTGSHFNEAHFVINDFSAAVLARNVLFLYLALKADQKEGSMHRLISTMWAIWYCHQLYPEHMSVLKEALTKLLSISESIEAWTQESNVLRNVVIFGSPKTLHNLRHFWKVWLVHDFGSVSNLAQIREAFLCERCEDMTDKQGFTLAAIMSYQGTATICDPDKLSSMKDEVRSYHDEGSAFAEMVLGMVVDTDSTTAMVNPTFFEAKDHSYTLHYASKPFDCFFHADCFSKTAGSFKRAPSNPVTINESFFQSKFLLANSVQQFAVWVQAVQEVVQPVLDQPQPCFTFSFYCCDALEFCQLAELKTVSPAQCKKPTLESFDVIHTSNLIDHIALPALVTSSVRLLKTKGLLFTTSFLYKSVAPTVDQYLEKLLGFKPEMLPVICGALCIGHEGRYADPIAVQPSPYSFESSMSTLYPTGRCTKLLVWQKTNSTPLMISNLAESPVIAKALVGSFQSASKSISDKEGVMVKVLLCTETAVQMLLTFVRQLEAKAPCNEFQFWENLADLIREDSDLRPFQTHIQTQALFHKIHLHLTMSCNSCPICQGKLLSSTVARYSVIVDPEYFTSGSLNPFFSAFVHKSQETSFVNDLCAHGLGVLNKLDVHIIDSSWGTHTNGKIRMKFLLPRCFAENGYYVTVAKSNFLTILRKTQCTLQSLMTVKLADVETKGIEFLDCVPCRSSSLSSCSTLGELVHHIGDGDDFQSVIAFTGEVAKLFKGPQVGLDTQKVAENALKLSCAGNALTIKYPHPVDYDSVKVQLSRSKGIVSIQSPRTVHSFWTRPTVFTASPDNELCFPAVTVDEGFYPAISGLQYSKHDRAIRASRMHQPFLMPVDLNVKGTFTSLLQTKKDERFAHFVNFESKDGYALIVLNSKVYDLENKSPALDLYYHFITEKSEDLVFEPWSSMIEPALDGIRNILMTKGEFLRLQVIFQHFSVQTRTKSNAPSTLLSNYGISQYFSRAVLYPLYIDQDKFADEMGIGEMIVARINQPREHLPAEKASKYGSECKATSNRTEHSPTVDSFFKAQHCDHCHTQSSNLKKCTRCDKAAYCNKVCQRSHWKEHRLVCQPTSQETPQPALDKCSGCKRANKQLKKCPCHLAAYCSVECQRNDWLRHSATCKSAKGKK